MSLLQRVTSIDGIDYDPNYVPSKDHRYGSVKSVRRVISYDVLPRPQEESFATHPTGGVTAYKVSAAQRFAQIVITIVSCWLASGIVFGFAALKPVLVDQGVYREYCSAEELELGVEVCYEQDLRLNIFFAIASTTCNISALLVGTILDRYGPRVAGIIGSLSLAAGTILMGSAFAIPEFDGYIAGNVLLSLGGTFIFVPSFQVANAFPKWSGTIVAMVTGAFDASAAVFLFFRLAYEASEGSFGPEKFFFGYLIVPVFILLAQVTVMNHDGYKTLPELERKIEKEQDAARDVHDSDDELSDNEVTRLRENRREHRESNLQKLEELVGDAEERHIREEKKEEHFVASGVWGALHGKSATEQMLSPWFILITLLTVLQMLRMNFFIATIRSQYEYMLSSERLARHINEFFDIALPIGGVAATPFIGILLDNVSTAVLLAGLVALITAVGILGSLPFLWAAYGNVILFVLLRPLYYSAMSDYAAKVFGFATFGRVYGTIICFSGVINLSQPLIDAANHEVFHDDPIPINVTLASLGLVFGAALVGFVWLQGRKVEMKPSKVDERTRLLPDTIEEEA
ncbi:Putative major facilitator superfamily, MFS transporter superfamily [Septoria linicola]|uniref:Major facilitator superfamily, MFS transporter superfamily n=1 Tax=Septoria linicola TaxID=215465 RepID=A0A9Q9AS91_9PEZI|nr:putative major facilitator superfamily, MFS transporter superfamily [Septoria linicola]USW51193.1 Putative major facilitator superfamily, MFS transporter superfamily [Septoria linicola]